MLSTLHTNSAAGTVTRLLDMGIPDYLLTSTINGILAQRLVRRLCALCREAVCAGAGIPRAARIGARARRRARSIAAAAVPPATAPAFAAASAIVELMPVSAAMRRLILAHAETQEIEATAIAEGMRTMFAAGLALALAGITTVEEVLRVTRAA